MQLADERGERATGLLAEDTIDDGVGIGRRGGGGIRRAIDDPAQMGSSQIGRTSMAPSRAPGIFAASSRASSRSFTSTM